MPGTKEGAAKARALRAQIRAEREREAASSPSLPEVPESETVEIIGPAEPEPEATAPATATEEPVRPETSEAPPSAQSTLQQTTPAGAVTLIPVAAPMPGQADPVETALVGEAANAVALLGAIVRGRVKALPATRVQAASAILAARDRAIDRRERGASAPLGPDARAALALAAELARRKRAAVTIEQATPATLPQGADSAPVPALDRGIVDPAA